MMGIVGIALAVNAALMAVGGAAKIERKYVKDLVLNFVKALNKKAR